MIKILLFLSAIFLCGKIFPFNPEFILKVPEKSYFEEQEVILTLTIYNKSEKCIEIEIPYLQPEEKNFLFVGKEFTFEVIANEKKLKNFTNHMPPEPRPRIKKIKLNSGEKYTLFIPFPFYYYPIELPAEFSVTLFYNDIKSNTVKFKVLKTEGKKEGEEIIVNGDFKEGEKFPYGWKIENENVKWEKEKGVIIFNMDKNTAYGEGMWIYSIFYRITSPSKYKLYLKAKSEGAEIIVFVEGWGLVKGRKRRLERNECFAHPGKNRWKEYNFNVIFTRKEVRWMRIKIYTYLKPGKIVFDKISLVRKK